MGIEVLFILLLLLLLLTYIQNKHTYSYLYTLMVGGHQVKDLILWLISIL